MPNFGTQSAKFLMDRENRDRPEWRYFKPFVHGYYGTVKNFTEGRKGHEGKNRRSPPGSKAEALTQPLLFPVEPGGLRRQQSLSLCVLRDLL